MNQPSRHLQALRYAPHFLWMGMVLLACLSTAGRVHADTIVTEAGEEIAGAQMQVIRGGTLYYLRAGAIEQIDVQRIARLQFDNLPGFNDAERFIARGDNEEALDRLLASIARAGNELERLWLHRRLAQVHDRLGDFVEAASHFGAVVSIDASPAWADLRPRSEPNEPVWHAVAEARLHLQRASRSVDHALRGEGTDRAGLETLQRVVAELLSKIEPLYEEEHARNPRRQYQPGSTVSGILTGDLDQGWPGRNREPERPRPDGSSPPEVETPPTREMTPVRPIPPARESRRDDPVEPSGSEPASIEALLAQGRYGEALALCERVAPNPGNRDMAEYLHQYGRALAGVNRPGDAAVRFMQCATHFPGTVHATKALYETARLCTNVFGNEPAAKRLLERALDHAAALDDEGLVRQIRTLLESLS